MELVVTDLTRMYGGNICVAGIDRATNQRVRPVARRGLSSKLLHVNGGPLRIGAIVELGSVKRVGRRPAVEDVRFNPLDCKVIEEMPATEFYSLLWRVSQDDLTAIGPRLNRLDRSLVTDEGEGDCSLILVQWDKPVDVRVEGERLRLSIPEDDLHALLGQPELNVGLPDIQLGEGANLSVTDIRYYDDDLETPIRSKVNRLAARLAAQPEVILAFGLGRAWTPSGRAERHHFLQLNNIHIVSEPDRPFASTTVSKPVNSNDTLADFIRKAREKHPRAYEPWSADEDRKVVEAWRTGKGAAEIAKDLGRNSGAIRSRLKKLGADLGEGSLPSADTLDQPAPTSQDHKQEGQARREAILRHLQAERGQGEDVPPKPERRETEQVFMLLRELIRGRIQRPAFSLALDDMLQLLDERTRRILELRFGLTGQEPMTLQEIGNEFGLTRERIRQIESKALRRLKHPSRLKRLIEALS